MRFEDMTRADAERLLKSIHKKVNQALFAGKLKDIHVEYYISLYPGNEKRNDGTRAIACYDHYGAYYGADGKLIMQRGATITFDFIDFKKFAAMRQTEKEQAQYITSVMIHEMCHQYCFENHIDDSNHNENFQTVAAQHGLHSLYREGKHIEEWLLPEGIAAAEGVTIG